MARASSDAADLSLTKPADIDAGDQRLPLVVDMDGFLIQADISADTRIADLERRVARMRRAVRGDVPGVPPVKIAEYARKGIDVSQLPLRSEFAVYVIACIEMGRTVHLVTSASQEIADAVAMRLGLFTSVSGAAAGRAMTDARKLAHARDRCPEGFVYAGREPSLIVAAEAIVVPLPDRASLAIARDGDTRIEALIEQSPARASTWMRVLGSSGWVRHALVFLPALLSPAPLVAGSLGMCAAGFVMMCLAASSASLVEGLMQLWDERRNVALRHRPPALGEIEPGLAAAVAVLLGAGCIAASLSLSGPVFLCIAGFLTTRLAWTWMRERRAADGSRPASACEPTIAIAWALVLGGVLAGLTAMQVLPSVAVVLAVIWVRSYARSLPTLRARADVSGFGNRIRAAKTRR